MSTHTVFRFVTRNGLDGLKDFQEPIPTPGPDEVLIKVRGVGLNYRDIAISTDQYPFGVRDSVIPCNDMAGEVVALGPVSYDESSTTGRQVYDLPTFLAVGDAVLAPLSPSLLTGIADGQSIADGYGARSDGFLCEYVVLPASFVIKIEAPCESQEDYLRWAVTPCVMGTAWNSLFSHKPLKPGQTMLTLGTGGVSLASLILAKAAGAVTIITSSSDKKLEFVKSRYGADHVINYKTHPNWAAEVMRITNGRGAHHVIEIGGSGTLEQSLASCSFGAVVSISGFLASTDSDSQKASNVANLILARGCIVRGILGATKEQIENANRCLVQNGLELNVDKTFGFTREEVVAALKHLASGVHIGKVCISVGA